MSDELTLRLVCNELGTLNRKSYHVGVQLGISHDKMMEFKKEDDPLAAVLDYWLSGNAGPCSWQSIVAMLRSPHVDEGGIANKIEKKYCGVKQQEAVKSTKSEFSSLLCKSAA